MDDSGFDYSEFVVSKLCEYADPKTRLEKKRIQKQLVYQNCREWLKDLVNLDPEEIEMLAGDEGEAREIRKDHAKYVRKAVFDEYTFKKKPVTEELMAERQFRDSARKKTMELLNELKREQLGDCELDNDEYRGFLRNKVTVTEESGNGTLGKGKKWFIRPWLAKRGVSNESVCITSDRNRLILTRLQRIVKEVFEDDFNQRIPEIIRLMRAGILFDAIYVRVQEMVRTIVNNARRHVPESDHKWLAKLEEDSPETMTDHMVDEIFEEAPLSYFRNKIKNHFVEAFTMSILETLIGSGVIEKDPTLVMTNFDRKAMLSIAKREFAKFHRICTNFDVAEKIAKLVADEVVDFARFRLDVPAPDSEPSEPERDLKALYEQRVMATRKKAEKQAKKNLEYLRDPKNPKKDPFEVASKEDKYGKSECKCSRISELGGKKRPFVYPAYKIKANYFFYNQYISDKNKNSISATLYPDNKQNVKLVCDDHWNCLPVPLERELRDIPYRFSYAPQFVVKQIQKTKSIKKSDRPLINRILVKMEQTKKVFDMDAVVKKVKEEKRYVKPEMDKSSESGLQRFNPDLISSSVTISAASEIISDTGSTFGGSRAKVMKGSIRSGKMTSGSHSIRYSCSSEGEDARLKKAEIPKTVPRLLKIASRESQVPKAPEPVKYHEHILEGYSYDMIPITPCRFHSLKKIKAVLKRFETAGTPAALEYHFENRQPPVRVNELLPVPRLVDTFKKWRTEQSADGSLWTRALKDSRLKRMAKFRKMYHKDPVFGFTSNWENPGFKCPY